MELFELSGADVSCSSIASVGYTRQKLKFSTLHMDELLCSKFVSDVSIYEKDMLVFVDESGLDNAIP